ncbi:MFS transporter [Enterococcus sp. HY326]|uniref:MFS transporter n=1 Tax=Enterococcus sp. HY326 TaxID=2971265 RepID=UPI00223F72FB|nr:MFS transporter [Enterococcus sp. HY326]
MKSKLNLLQILKESFAFKSSGLSFWKKFQLSLPAPILSVSQVIIHQVFIKYYTDVIGLSAAWVGWVYVLYNIWNAINDPLIGSWLDHKPYNPKRGKYAYIMKVTVPFMMLATFLMALSSPSWSQWTIFIVFSIELFFFDTASTAYGIAYTSYTQLAAPSKEERLDIGTIGNYLTYALSFMATMIPTLLLIGDGNRALFIPILMGVLVVQTIIFVLALRGLKDTPEMYANLHHDKSSVKKTVAEAWKIIKTRPFLTTVLYGVIAMSAFRYYSTAYLYYMDSVIQATGSQATIINFVTHLIALGIMPVSNYSVKNLGTRINVFIGMLPATLGYLGLTFATELWQVSIAFGLVVICTIHFATSTAIMNSLIIDEDEWRTGIRKTGLFNGMFTLFGTALSSVFMIMYTNVMAATGYDGTLAVQSAEAVRGLRFATGILPLICIWLGIIPMILYPFNRKREQEISAESRRMRGLDAND